MKNIFLFLLALIACILISAIILLISSGCIITMEPTLWDFIKSITILTIVIYAVMSIVTYLINFLFVYAFTQTKHPRTMLSMLIPLHAVSAIVTVYLLFVVPINYSGYHYALAVILSIWAIVTHYNFICKHLAVSKMAAVEQTKKNQIDSQNRVS